MSGGGVNLIESALGVSRSRSSWNSWLEQAEKPASDHEEMKIERAASMATALIMANKTLVEEGAKVVPQGSYYNNTNARYEADMDLRLQLPGIKTICLEGVSEAEADAKLGYSYTGRKFEEILSVVRRQLEIDLVAKFGTSNVDLTGSKAIKVHGLDGSRADCDIVPAFRLHAISSVYGQPFVSEGTAIFGRDGRLTMNFPDQHHENGIQKRRDTSHRFKRNVRMLKRLNYELEEVGDIPKRIPSFLAECLVYRVENEHFLFETDDRYLRLGRILMRLSALLADAQWCNDATEINDIKFLFRSGQAWTVESARSFVHAALRRLGY